MRMHLEKNRLDQIQNGHLVGHYSFSHGRYLVNRARWLDHITIKQSVSFRGRVHPENFQLANTKWPTISIIYLDRPDIR